MGYGRSSSGSGPVLLKVQGAGGCRSCVNAGRSCGWDRLSKLLQRKRKSHTIGNERQKNTPEMTEHEAQIVIRVLFYRAPSLNSLTPKNP